MADCRTEFFLSFRAFNNVFLASVDPITPSAIAASCLTNSLQSF